MPKDAGSIPATSTGMVQLFTARNLAFQLVESAIKFAIYYLFSFYSHHALANTWSAVIQF